MPLALPRSSRPPGLLITPWSLESIGVPIQAAAQAVPASALNANAAQLALYVPFRLAETVTCYKVFWNNGTAVAGNVDVGVYTEAGLKLLSAGATAQTTVSVLQEVDTTNTVLPGPARYYMGFVATDATTATFLRISMPLGFGQSLGICSQASQTALPASATFADPGGAFVYLPVFGIALRTLAAV
jgi:hypothetical protein